MFLKKLDYLIQKNDLNKNALSLQSGIPVTTIHGFYQRGYENIRISTLRKLSDFFEVSLDYLIDNSIDIEDTVKKVELDNLNNQNVNFNTLTLDEIEVLRKYQSVNDKGKEQIMKYVNYISADDEFKKFNSNIQEEKTS